VHKLSLHCRKLRATNPFLSATELLINHNLWWCLLYLLMYPYPVCVDTRDEVRVYPFVARDVPCINNPSPPRCYTPRTDGEMKNGCLEQTYDPKTFRT
ncbi:unnamed protein product, partial [Pylaiella littoralis]